MRNICEELWHNLRSGTSVNLILILLFALFFWQGTVISTYFADITSSSAPGRQKNGEYCYYSLENIYSTGDDASRMYQDQDPTAVENMDRTYREIHEELGDRYFSYNEISMQRDYEELSRRFTDEELLDFYAGSLYPGYYDSSDTEVSDPFHPIGKISNVFYGQNSCLDENAIRHFNLQVSEGRLFTEEDFTYHSGQKILPVLVGNAYGKRYQTGDEMRAYLCGDVKLKIVGILKENTSIVTDKILAYYGQPVLLDYAVILPFFYFEDKPATEEECYFAYSNYGNGLGGTIVLPADAPRSEINTLAKQVSNIFVKNGLNPKIPADTSYGVFLFQEESEQTMRIFLAAGIVMAVLAISGICMSMIVKLNRNLHRYGIEIMNGQSVYTILTAFLLEMILVMGAGLLLNIWQFMNLIHSNLMFLVVLLFLAGTAALIVSTVFIRKLRKVDIEKIIRSEE